MTYLGFHLVFILPPIAALALWLRARPGGLRRRWLAYLPLIALIAFVYTTPWDNYLVWRGVWGYGSDRVIGTIGYVPVEEYLFFVLQPLLAGLWLYRVLADRDGVRDLAAGAAGRARVLGALLYLAAALAGGLMLLREETTYLGLILAWAAPVLAGQWAYAGAEIWRRRRSWALGVAVPTLYLWVADAIAIRLGIWEISERYTVGLQVWTLPLEEAVFFLVTNLLVVQGLILFLHPPGRSSVVGRRSSLLNERVGTGSRPARPKTDDRRPTTF
jgi:lycopene beta-cyclase